MRHEGHARISAARRKEQEASSILCRRLPSTALHTLSRYLVLRNAREVCDNNGT